MNLPTKISCLALLSCLPLRAAAPVHRQPADYVDPNIGGIGQLLTATLPYAQYPHGMARVAPTIDPAIDDRYLAGRLNGLSIGPLVVMAAEDRAAVQAPLSSAYDHDFETAHPYWYSVRFDDTAIVAEVAPAPQSAIFQFTIPAKMAALLSLRTGEGGEVMRVGAHAVQGSQFVLINPGEAATKGQGVRQYFYAEFSVSDRSDPEPPALHATDSAGQASNAPHPSNELRLHFAEDSIPNRNLQLRVGISYIGTEQARRNLQREIPDWQFNAAKARAYAAWNQALSKVVTTGGTPKQLTIFYTALYRSFSRMTDITEDGSYFSGFDHQVHPAEGHSFYVDDGLWDTYRSMHPLMLLLEPAVQMDEIRSYLRMYEQTGTLPSFPSATGERAVMIGHHATAFLADAYQKGYRDFDVDLAYKAMRHAATETTLLPWHRGPKTQLDEVYDRQGFFPALREGEKETVPEVNPERRQAVSVTLETSYDDWCLAQMARALGKTEDEQLFLKRAANYRKLFDPRIGFMAPRSADGAWVTGFDPKLGGGQGARDYFTEVNSWIYTFHVQHDPAGLIDLMGGRDRFNQRLDRLFEEQYTTSKYFFLAQFPDATGLVGQYAQGNEPSFHIPYLYVFSGQPWKTQKMVRTLMDVWYGDGPLGLSGDDDGGALSSWYVLSALGFYPVCPGSPVYELGSPLFTRSVLDLGHGRKFVIEAPNASAQNKYIQSATLNGKNLDRAWFRHDEIANGATLRLEMGPRPNLTWGSAPSQAPPSMSTASATNATQ